MEPATFIALDVETANADRASICQLGLAGFVGDQLASQWKSLINPEDQFDPFNISIHGITEDAVREAPTFAQLAEELRSLLAGQVVVSHTHFDRGAIGRAFEKVGQPAPDCTWVDSAAVARGAWPDAGGYGLQRLCEQLGYQFQAHDALEDAKAAGLVLLTAMKTSGVDLAFCLEHFRQYGPGGQGRNRRFAPSSKVQAEGNPSGPLYGEVLVFTGELAIPRDLAAEQAARIGCEVAAGVTKRTTLLVIGNQDARLASWDAKSTKQKKAEALIAKGHHIHILSELDFERLVEQFAVEETTA